MLRAENISRRFFRMTGQSNFFYAVKDVNIELKSGALTEITGRSGSGKSTLLHMLAGLLKPTDGMIYIKNQDLYNLDDKARSKLRGRKIGIIPQGQTGLHSLTVLENIILPCVMYQDGAEKPDEWNQKAVKLLEQVGIARLKDSWPDALSGGELRRMAIARALIREPEILLADEPTGDLDDENTEMILKLLRNTANQGAAVLLVTHEREAAKYADVIYTMREGCLFSDMKS